MPSPLDSINWGTSLDDNNVTVYFALGGLELDGYTSDGFNFYEIGQFQEAFDSISDVTGLTFTVTNSPNADFTLILDTDDLDFYGYLGIFAPPEFGEYPGLGVFNGAAWDRTGGGNLEVGGFGYVTIVHELLHGLGLAHPHDDGGSSSIMTGVTGAFDDYGSYDLNQGVFTVMSYNAGYPSEIVGDFSGYYGFESGPSALDIALLQQLYGTGGNNNHGNSVYTLPGANATGTYWKTIWDTGGTDEIRYDGTRDITIDLRAATLEYGAGGGGFVSSANNIAGGFTITNGVVIENASGGKGNDLLIGNAANNMLEGDNGNDRLVGNEGNDRLFGRGGNDKLFGGDGADLVSGHSGNDRLVGSDGFDRLIGSGGKDTLWGQNDRDLLFGGGGIDKLFGGGGDDLIAGNGDVDYLFGGDGADIFDYNIISDSRSNASRRDIIGDFDAGEDRIDMSDLDADKAVAGDQAFTYIGTGGFTGNGGEIRIIEGAKHTLIQTDINGDGKAEVEILLLNETGLPGSDFIL